MSTNRDLFAGAIAEAKAVKNMAIENAKLALEETFTPQIKSMFSAKLREMEEEEMEEMEAVEETVEMDEVESMDEMEEMDLEEELELDETEVTEDLDLDELLAEIESEESEELNEVEEEEIEVEDDEESEETEDEDETPLNIEDMTEDDLAKMIEDIMLEEFPQLAQMKGEEGDEDDMDLDLDIEDETEEESDLDLAEMLREIEEEDEVVAEANDEELEELRAELEEAHTTINTLRTDLNEVNVLNAKLLYTNKIFRSKNLNESQKVKVLSSFDKAESVKDVELVYETLNEGLIVKQTVKKPSLGSASKSTFTPETKKPIIESNAAFLRMQKLAGIIKD